MKRLKPSEMKMSVYDILLILLILMIIGGFLVLRVGRDESPRAKIRTEQANSYMYTSPLLHISLLLGNEFAVKEGNNNLTFSSEQGTIVMTRTATNFSTAKEYVDYIASQNKFENYTSTPFSMHGLDSVLVENKTNDGKSYRTYLLYVDHWIYSIETTSSSLYAAQDAMADSFRYIPSIK